jgi:hypothetical protein
MQKYSEKTATNQHDIHGEIEIDIYFKVEMGFYSVAVSL